MFSGSIPALVTPFRDDAIDVAALRALVDWHVEAGSGGIVACGTTGEAPTLDLAEHYRVVEIVVEQAAGRIPVIAGCGSNDTRTALQHMARAQAIGADAALVVAPYYNRPSQAGMIAHFSALAASCDLPILLYNVPARTVADLLPATVAALAKIDTIVGIKDASGVVERVVDHRLGCGPDFCQLTGNDAQAVAFAALGGVGCISVTANVAPALCAELQDACAAGERDRANRINDRLHPLHCALFADASPAPTKYALARLRDDVAPATRLPIAPCSDAAKAAVDAALTGLGLV